MSISVGEQLKRARELKHISLEEAAQSTFIKIHFLEALENDRKEELFTAVQARGFLRIYADLLNLPAGPLLASWDGKTIPDEELSDDPHELFLASETPVETVLDNKTISNQPLDKFVLDDSLEEITAPVSKPEMTANTSEGIFKEIGQVLRKRRETLKISHEDIEKFVHIRPRYLLALEEGHLEDLPSTVQGRGMLTNYAHFLEVDTNLLQFRFAEGLQLRRLELNPPPVKKKSRVNDFNPDDSQPQKLPNQPSFLKRSLTPDLLIGGSLIILLFGFALWSTIQVIAMRNVAIGTQAPNISSVLLETSSPQTLIPAQATIQATSAMAREATNQASTQNSIVQPTTTVQVDGDLPLQIYVVARQNAWMQVTIGKKVAFNGRVVPGNAYPFSGNERVELITGNAAALQVFYNQRDLGSLGLSGQVASLIFTLDGIVTPTPKFSPTPTSTIQPTVTAQPSPTKVPATVTPLIPIK
jgi:cytoskeleton protein RodZ